MANVPDLVVATYAQQPMQVLRHWREPCGPVQQERFRLVGWSAAGEPLGYSLDSGCGSLRVLDGAGEEMWVLG
jgi:hypothetical protein